MNEPLRVPGWFTVPPQGKGLEEYWRWYRNMCNRERDSRRMNHAQRVRLEVNK